jgi:NAD(P)H-dependent FMN reductase
LHGLVDDNIDRHCDPSEDEITKQSLGEACECFTSRADKVAMMAAPQTPNAYADFINVLVLVGLPAGPVNCALSRLAIDSSPDGVMVNVFDDLMGLPRYNEALETHGTPDAVVALRLAATEADAVLILTSYRRRIPSMAHSAIDWLTRRWRGGALHDKPLAVIGRSTGCYSGVWSRQVEDIRGGLGPRVIEPLTVPTLREAVKKRADEVHGGSAAAAI